EAPREAEATGRRRQLDGGPAGPVRLLDQEDDAGGGGAETDERDRGARRGESVGVLAALHIGPGGPGLRLLDVGALHLARREEHEAREGDARAHAREDPPELALALRCGRRLRLVVDHRSVLEVWVLPLLCLVLLIGLGGPLVGL